MTPSEACDPVFLRISELNRIGRTGGRCPEYSDLRTEMLDLLGDVRKSMLADSSLERHWAALELPLIFFVDSMISESQLPIASEWNRKRLAYERKELAGDQKFFDLLDATLADGGVDATARIPIFYTCLGLGFLGMHAGHPEAAQKIMADLTARITPPIGAELRNKITPEAYDHVDLRNLIQPTPIRTSVLVSMYLVLLLLCAVFCGYIFQKAMIGLRIDLNSILKHSLDAVQFFWK
jgi:type VI protein secretion system component VasF